MPESATAGLWQARRCEIIGIEPKPLLVGHVYWAAASSSGSGWSLMCWPEVQVYRPDTTRR